MPEDPTILFGVGFDGRVSTAAGSAGPGEEDGTGPEVTNHLFFSTVTPTTSLHNLTTFGFLGVISLRYYVRPLFLVGNFLPPSNLNLSTINKGRAYRFH